MGMFAGSNDIELMECAQNGRDINRHYYTAEDVEREQERPVVQKLKELMELRNFHPAFGLEGSISVKTYGDRLVITRSAVIENEGENSVFLTNAASLCLDLPREYTDGKQPISILTSRRY